MFEFEYNSPARRCSLAKLTMWQTPFDQNKSIQGHSGVHVAAHGQELVRHVILHKNTLLFLVFA